MKASILVPFLIFSSAFLLLSSAFAYSIVDLPAEKSSRATVCIQDWKASGFPEQAYISYKVGNVNPVALAGTYFDTRYNSSSRIISNSQFSIFVDPTTGEYRMFRQGDANPLILGNAEIKGEYDDGIVIGRFTHPTPPYSVRGPSLLQGEGIAPTLHWVVEDNYIRVDRFLTIFSNRSEADLRVRISPKVPRVSIENSSIDKHSFNFAEFSAVSAVEKEGEYLGGWSDYLFRDGELWLSARNVSSASIGVAYSSADEINKSGGEVRPLESFTLRNNSGQVFTKEILLAYSPASPNITRNYLLSKTLSQNFNLSNSTFTCWQGFRHSWDNVTHLGAQLNFSYVKPEEEPNVATLAFEISNVDTNPLECNLNLKKLFRENVTNNSVKLVTVPISYLSSTNKISCFARVNITNKFDWLEELGLAYSRPRDDPTARANIPNFQAELTRLGINYLSYDDWVASNLPGLPPDLHGRQNRYADYLYRLRAEDDPDDRFIVMSLAGPMPELLPINITSLELRLGDLSRPEGQVGGGHWLSLPISVSNSESSSKNPNVTLQLSKLDLLGFPQSSFLLLENGKVKPLDFSPGAFTFSTTLASNETKTLQLLFSPNPPINHNVPGMPDGNFLVSNFAENNGVSVDVGPVLFLTPYRKITPSSTLSSRVIPAGADTMVAKRLVFDRETGRAAIVKLTVWRKG